MSFSVGMCIYNITAKTIVLADLLMTWHNIEENLAISLTIQSSDGMNKLMHLNCAAMEA